MPQQLLARLGIRLPVLRQLVLALGDGELRAGVEAIGVEGGAQECLALGAVAEEKVGGRATCEGVFDGTTVARASGDAVGVDIDVDIVGRDFEELLPLFSGHYVILSVVFISGM